MYIYIYMCYTCIYIIYIHNSILYINYIFTATFSHQLPRSQERCPEVSRDFRSATVLGRLHCGSRDLEAPGRPGISLEDIMGYLWGVLKWNISWDLWDLCDHGENEKWSNDLDGLGVSAF